jgi:hypothetical protein
VVCQNCRDAWTWAATYTSGSVLRECDGSGTHRGFAEVDQSRLESLAWLPLRPGLPRLAVRLEPGQRGVLFRRRSLEVQFGASVTAGDPLTLHALGYAQDGAQSLLFAAEDGSVLLSSNPQAVYPISVA